MTLYGFRRLARYFQTPDMKKRTFLAAGMTQSRLCSELRCEGLLTFRAREISSEHLTCSPEAESDQPSLFHELDQAMVERL